MYNLILYIYAFGAWVVSFFNKKVKKMIVGQRQTPHILQQGIHEDDRVAWFHASSLGEFEQGRPLMERLRRHNPDYKILLTFFSPSGYEVRKDYDGADVVCYLPFDTPRRAQRFLQLAHPEIGIFIKYEFWQNYLVKAHRRGTRLYSVSSIFRPGQHFFRWGGNPKPLLQFNHLFVQNEQSKQLLATLGISNVTIVGDTRFDRVIDIRNAAKNLPIVESFLSLHSSAPVFIVGSSWEPDENIYIPYFANHAAWKLVIAPHVVSPQRIEALQQHLRKHNIPSTTYSQLKNNPQELHTPSTPRALIIDCYGKLSSIYRYATIAAVGGGFGAGIHNVPEAAVYAIPVLFGPNNKKFREAQALLQCGAAFEYTDATSFARIFDNFIDSPSTIASAGKKAGTYIQNNSGAADTVFNHIFR